MLIREFKNARSGVPDIARQMWRLVMVREFGENQAQAKLNDDGGNNETNVSFDIYLPDEVDDGRKQHGATNNTIIDGFDTASDKSVGLDFGASAAQIAAKQKFGDDAANQYDNNWRGVFDLFGGDDLFDRFDNDMNANSNNNDGDKNCADMFDFFVRFVEFFAGAEFFACDNDNAGKSVDQPVDGVGHDGKRVRNYADDDFEYCEQQIDADGNKSGFDNRLVVSGLSGFCHML